jgi:hypothetical protein
MRPTPEPGSQARDQGAVGAIEVLEQDPALVTEGDLQVRAADRGVGEHEIVDGAATDGDPWTRDLDLRALIRTCGDPQHDPPQLRVTVGRREKSGRHPRIEVVVDLRDSGAQGFIFAGDGHG